MPKDVNAAVATIKTKRTIQFVDWHLARIFIHKGLGGDSACQVSRFRMYNEDARVEVKDMDP